MVKLGFIVEGATEKIILDQSDFFNYLNLLSLQYIPEVIDAGGNGNLLPHNITAFTKILQEKGATHIFILTDLDTDQCITNTKNRIAPLPHHIVSVSVKMIESWFLSDTDAMRRYLNDTNFLYDNPESLVNPYEEIRTIRMKKLNRVIPGKVMLAKYMVDNCHFSIVRAAEHPNCNSAKYFLNKLQALSERS